MFSVRYDEAAEEDLRGLKPFDLKRVFDEVDRQLVREPARAGRRKKLLAGLIPPWDGSRPVWQLRVGDYRVFYDVDQEAREIIVRAVRRKGTKRTEDIL